MSAHRPMTPEQFRQIVVRFMNTVPDLTYDQAQELLEGAEFEVAIGQGFTRLMNEVPYLITPETCISEAIHERHCRLETGGIPLDIAIGMLDALCSQGQETGHANEIILISLPDQHSPGSAQGLLKLRGYRSADPCELLGYMLFYGREINKTVSIVGSCSGEPLCVHSTIDGNHDIVLTVASAAHDAQQGAATQPVENVLAVALPHDQLASP